MTAAELQLVIKAKDQSAKTFAAIKGRLNKFKSQVGRVAGGFKQLSKKFGTAMSSIARKAKWAALVSVAALTAMVVGSIRQFAKLESGLLDVQKTTGMSNEEIQKLRKSLEDLVLTTRGMTMEGLLNASAIAGQLGITGAKNIGIFSKAVEMMAIATKYTAEEAALDLAKIAKVMDLPISKSEMLGDVMNELSNRTTAFATQIGEITKRAGSMGKSFGLTIPEMMGFAATMIDVGVETQVGASAITRMLNQALLDTKGFAHVSGIEFTRYAKLVKEKPMEAIKKFIEGLGKLDKFKRMAALKELQLSGVRVAPALVAMSENTKLLSDNIKIANDQWKEGGSLMDEYKNRAKGLTSAFASIWEAVKIMASRLGDVFAPALKAFATKFQKQIKAVKDYVDKSGIVKAFQDMFGDIMGSMTKHLNILGWIKKVFGETPKEVQANLEKWKIKFIGFRKWLETNSPFEGIKIAFQDILKYVKWVGLGIGLLTLATNKWLSALAAVLIAFEAIQKIKDWGKIGIMKQKYEMAEDYRKAIKRWEEELKKHQGTSREKYYKEGLEAAKAYFKGYTEEGDKLAESIYGGKAQTPVSDFLRKTYLGVDEGTKGGGISEWIKKFKADINRLGKEGLGTVDKQVSKEKDINVILEERKKIYDVLQKARTKIPVETGRVRMLGKETVFTKEQPAGMSAEKFDKTVEEAKAQNQALDSLKTATEGMLGDLIQNYKDGKIGIDELAKGIASYAAKANSLSSAQTSVLSQVISVVKNLTSKTNALAKTVTRQALSIKQLAGQGA